MTFVSTGTDRGAGDEVGPSDHLLIVNKTCNILQVAGAEDNGPASVRLVRHHSDVKRVGIGVDVGALILEVG